VVDPLRHKYGSRATILLPLLLLGFVALSAWRMWPRGQDRPAATVAYSVDFGGPTMGTTWRVTVVTGGADTSKVQAALTAELDEIDRQMSNYRDDSVLARFNAHASAEPFIAPPALLTVVDLAAKVSATSGGAFDVTVAPLVDAWGFGRVKRADARPSDDDLAALRARVGWQKLHVDLSAGTLRKDQPDVVVDLSAIAPGYAADVLSDRLVALGFPNHLVDVGGEFRARGENQGGPWRVGVERPDGPVDDRAVQEVVLLRDAALATSGDYRNYREQDGVRISHTIDPRTGRPIAHRLASVTVVAAGAGLADAWATALNVLGPEDGRALAEREDLAALFLVREAGGFIAHATPAFEALRAAAPSANLSPR
jgi:thiamine biosynthesis lipoprotein